MSLFSRLVARPPRGDQGSIVLTLLASLIVGTLMLMLLTTLISTQKTARRDRDYTGVFHASDAGVQEALFRLGASRDSGTVLPAASSGEAACDMLPSTSKCFKGTLPNGKYEWFATRIGTGREWEVRSVAQQNGRRRELLAVIQEDRKFFASAFADNLAGFSNNNIADSYNSGSTGQPAFNPRPGRLGIVGSNGDVATGGSSTVVDGVQLWNYVPGNDTLSTRCSGQGRIGLTTAAAATSNPALYDGPNELQACNSSPVKNAFNSPPNDAPYTQIFTEKRVISPSLAEVEAGVAACGQKPSGPAPYPKLEVLSVGSVVSTKTTTYTYVSPGVFSESSVTVPGNELTPYTDASDVPGVSKAATGSGADAKPGYRCYSDVRFHANAVLGSAASATSPVVMYVTGSLEITNSAVKVNCSPCSTIGDSRPNAPALQIYFRGSGDVFKQKSSSGFGGTIHAPTGNCGNPGAAQAEVYGSMLCRNISNVGGWAFHYDEALAGIGNNIFRIVRTQEQ